MQTLPEAVQGLVDIAAIRVSRTHFSGIIIAPQFVKRLIGGTVQGYRLQYQLMGPLIAPFHPSGQIHLHALDVFRGIVIFVIQAPQQIRRIRGAPIILADHLLQNLHSLLRLQ